MPSQIKRYPNWLKKIFKFLAKSPGRYWKSSKLHQAVVILVLAILIITLAIAGIGEWYINSQRHIPMTYGVSFIPDYAESLGVNPKSTMDALLGIGIRQFRLTSYWSDIQPTPNSYNFSMLDWEFHQADKYHAKVVLVVGLRQPRWPECHPPNWVNTSAPLSSWEPKLLTFMQQVINRYKNNPALEAWQVENEYFLKGFGDCTNMSRSRLINEYNLVRKLDPTHPAIISRSNNAIGFPLGQPQPQVFGISVYKRVWDANVTHRYLEYPFPAWYYGFLAGVQEIFNHRNMLIEEMQAEAWPPNGETIPQASLSQQNKSITAARLKNRFNFARATGMRDAIMWGGEYWYYRMVVLHDPSLWNVAKQEYKASGSHTGEYFFTHLNS